MDLNYTSRRHGKYQDIEFTRAPSFRVKDALESLGYKYNARIMSWRGSGHYDEAIAVAEDAVKTAKKIANRKRQGETLCFSCGKSGYGNVSVCPWEREFRPVDGWNAEKMHKAGGAYRDPTDTYHVIGCPLYEPEPTRKAF